MLANIQLTKNFILASQESKNARDKTSSPMKRIQITLIGLALYCNENGSERKYVQYLGTYGKNEQIL